MAEHKNRFQTINPATGEALSEYEYFPPAEREKRIQRSWDAHLQWRVRPIEERARLLAVIASKFEESKEELARMMALEMGKPIKDGRAEIEKCVRTCFHVASQSQDWPRDRFVDVDGKTATIRSMPVGPILTVMPWNFPLWQLIRVLAPAVLVGNSVILKHSDQVAGTAELIESILADFSDILVNIRLPHEHIESVISDRRVRAVTLTGSVKAGSAIAALAGKHLKKVVLELGGSDPYLVFADADVTTAGKLCAQGRLINNGQSCISAKRFLVEKSVWDEFMNAFQRHLEVPVIGSPMQESTALGPLAHPKFLSQIEDQCSRAFEEGMVRAWSRSHGQARGAYCDVQILTGTGQERSFYEEEFFGPVAMVVPFEKESHALQMANQSIYGLGAAVFSKDLEKARRVASQLECGIAAWNDFVRSDVRFPFGGFKFSGFGRELGREGLIEFTQSQTLIF